MVSEIIKILNTLNDKQLYYVYVYIKEYFDIDEEGSEQDVNE